MGAPGNVTVKTSGLSTAEAKAQLPLEKAADPTLASKTTLDAEAQEVLTKEGVASKAEDEALTDLGTSVRLTDVERSTSLGRGEVIEAGRSLEDVDTRLAKDPAQDAVLLQETKDALAKIVKGDEAPGKVGSIGPVQDFQVNLGERPTAPQAPGEMTWGDLFSDPASLITGGLGLALALKGGGSGLEGILESVGTGLVPLANLQGAQADINQQTFENQTKAFEGEVAERGNEAAVLKQQADAQTARQGVEIRGQALDAKNQEFTATFGMGMADFLVQSKKDSALLGIEKASKRAQIFSELERAEQLAKNAANAFKQNQQSTELQIFAQQAAARRDFVKMKLDNIDQGRTDDRALMEAMAKIDMTNAGNQTEWNVALLRHQGDMLRIEATERMESARTKGDKLISLAQTFTNGYQSYLGAYAGAEGTADSLEVWTAKHMQSFLSTGLLGEHEITAPEGQKLMSDMKTAAALGTGLEETKAILDWSISNPVEKPVNYFQQASNIRQSSRNQWLVDNPRGVTASIGTDSFTYPPGTDAWHFVEYNSGSLAKEEYPKDSAGNYRGVKKYKTQAEAQVDVDTGYLRPYDLFSIGSRGVMVNKNTPKQKKEATSSGETT